MGIKLAVHFAVVGLLVATGLSDGGFGEAVVVFADFALSALSTVFLAVTAAVTYHDLRVAEEGTGS